MSHSQHNYASGFALVPALVIILLISIAAGFLTSSITGGLHLRGDIFRETRHPFPSLAKLRSTLEEETSGREISCRQLGGAAESLCVRARALFEGAQKIVIDGEEVPLPLIDVDRYNFENCTHIRSQVSATESLNGFRLSPSASRHTNTCLELPPSKNNHVAILENLALDSTLQLSFSQLFVAGYFESLNPLKPVGDTILIVGGDVHIPSVVGGENPLRLTIFSMTGVVVIDKFEGDLELKVFARRGAYVPKNARPQSSLIIPYMTPLLLEGLSIGG